MNFPLAELELSRTGKRVSTYAVRGVAVGVAWLVMGVVWLFSVLMNQAGGQSGAELGESYSLFLAYASRVFQFLAVFAVAPLFSAGLVAREKQEHTLGLLLMADLRGRDIFLAKYLSAFLYVELLVLSALPILAFASLFGGISVPEMALQVFLLTIAAAAMCAIGLFFSTITSRPVEALFATILFECAWIVGTSLFDFFCDAVALFSPSGLPAILNIPTTSIMTAAWGVNRFSTSPGYWLLSAGIAVVLGVIAALLTIALLPRQAWDKPKTKGVLARRASSQHTRVCLPRERKRRRFLRSRHRQEREGVATDRPGRRRKRLLSRELFPMTPLTRLASASAPGLAVFRKPWPIQCLVAVALTPLGLLGCMGCLGRLPILLIICYDITSSITGARDDGSFDALLMTPTEDRTLARGLFSIYIRRGVLFLPALAALGLMGMAQWMVAFSSNMETMGGDTGYLLAVGGSLVLHAVISPIVTLLFYVALGCWASTFKFGPVGQSSAAVGIYLGISIPLYILTTILATFAIALFQMVPAMVEGFASSGSAGSGVGWVDFSALFFLVRAVIPGVLTAGISLALALVFYQLFARHLATRWRTGRLLFSGPASR